MTGAFQEIDSGEIRFLFGLVTISKKLSA